MLKQTHQGRSTPAESGLRSRDKALTVEQVQAPTLGALSNEGWGSVPRTQGVLSDGDRGRVTL